MSLPEDSSSAPARTCIKCGFVFDSSALPGGLCPRCLLSDFQGGLKGAASLIETVVQPGFLEAGELENELPEFEFIEVIGIGGGGVVWKAVERALDRQVAVKLMVNRKQEMDFALRFEREARVMAHMNHSNIVAIHSFGRTLSNHCYLVMELVEGTHLGKIMSLGPMDVANALSITNDVGHALLHAHREGYIHRDIKPGNVLISQSGRVKVGDFGLARVSNEEGTTTLTARGWALGTPHYIAPEQARGDGKEDHRADIYSLGVMLYQMLTGELPRGVFRLPSMKRMLDKRIDSIVTKALQEDPSERYQTVELFLADLGPVREKYDPVLQRQLLAERQMSKRQRRFEMALAVGVSVVLGIIIADFVRGWLQRPTERPEQAIRWTGGVNEMTPPILSKESGLVIARKFKLQPESLTHGSFFGRSVSLSGNWLAVGAPDDRADDAGSVYLFQRDPSKGWILQQRLGGEGKGRATRFGFAVSMNGPHLAVAAPRRIGSERVGGHVFLFGRTPQGVWTLSGSRLFPPLEVNVSSPGLKWIDGRLAVFDMRAPPLATALAIREMSKRGNVWQSVPTNGVTLKNAFGGIGTHPLQMGSELTGEGTAILGSCAVLGRSREGSGEVEIYRIGGVNHWSSPTVLKPDTGDGADSFGMTCRLDRNTLIIGAPSSGFSEDGAGTGAVFVYELAQPIQD